MNTIRTLSICLVVALLFAIPASAQQPDPSDPGYEAWKMEEAGVEDQPVAPVPERRIKAATAVNPASSMSPLVPYPGDGGWTLLPKNDDGSTGIFPLPFPFELYGSVYEEICVNNNGNVSFEDCYSTFDPVGFPDDDFIMVAPFWADVDTCDPGDDCTGEVAYKTTTINGETVFVAHWEEVGFFFENESLRNTFQVVIADGPTLPGGNNVCFGYGDMNWTTGDASGGSGGFGGDPATVGANKGDGAAFFQYGRFDMPGADYDGPSGDTDGVDHLDSRQICFNTGAASDNIPPVIVSEPGAPIVANAGDPISFSVEFIPPESDQGFNSVSYSLNGGITLADISCSTTFGPPGGVTVASCSGSVGAPGSYSIDVTGTDDGSPPLSTSTTVEIQIEDGDDDGAPPVCGEITIVPVGDTYEVVSSATDNVGIASVTFTTLTPNLDGYVDDGGAQGPFMQGDVYTTGDPDPTSVGLRARFITPSAASFFVTVADAAGNEAVCDPVLTDLAGALPEATALEAAYPNPARVSSGAPVSVPFRLAEASEVRVVVYDVLGREVAVLADGVMEPGRYEVSWPEAASLPAGSYVVRMTAGAHVQTQRLTLLR
jgi:hypothetical protein